MVFLGRIAPVAAVFLLACGGDETETRDFGGHAPTGVSASSSASGFGVTCSPSASCPFGEYCDQPDGGCVGDGICKMAPMSCTGECTGVCGCDGSWYCNACVALISGVDVDVDGSCEPPPPFTSVVLLAEQRLWIYEQDWARDLCTQIVLAPEADGSAWQVDVTPPYGIESIVATDRALDCQLPPAQVPLPPMGETIAPTGATGTVVIESPEVPCALSADLALAFEPRTWIGESESVLLGYSTLVLCD